MILDAWYCLSLRAAADAALRAGIVQSAVPERGYAPSGGTPFPGALSFFSKLRASDIEGKTGRKPTLPLFVSLFAMPKERRLCGYGRFVPFGVHLING